MTAEDYLKMPDRINIYDRVELSPKVLAQYKEFEKEQVLELINSNEPISAASAAAETTSFVSSRWQSNCLFEDLNIRARMVIFEDFNTKSLLIH
jgi:hypothetical protein